MTATMNFLLLTSLIATESQAAPSPPACRQEIHRGFDSRLEVEVIGRLPPGDGEVRGFELVGTNPVVAFEHRLLAFGPEETVGMPVLDRVDGLAVYGERGLRVLTSKGHLELGPGGLRIDAESRRLGAGKLFNSGTEVYLAVTDEASTTVVELRHPLGPSFPLAGFEGKLRTASWNRYGMALVVDGSLFTWEEGAEELLRLLHDEGLRSAVDVVLAGPDRAIIALEHSVVLVTRETVLVLVAFPARVRYQEGRLYLLDVQTGLLWRATGLDRLGSIDADRAHGRALLQEAASSLEGRERSQAFLEASRILGCRAAMAQAPWTTPSVGGERKD